MRKLHGLRQLMPITSDAGDRRGAGDGRHPMLNGFLSKEMFFALALEIEQHDVMRT
jgi:multicomponent K+:H+ antiporter subunit A